ncbi:NfrA family protein [Motilimonas pumila]|uniref:Bacteriophage N4 adsorption protein A C-terminal domain-containing protein n=1 Tax=Motilimonas pumila TaxID=2303987 RepID=A0A418YH36_9GAMM|nr:tetratricopeptide repeat protein [Motilimonas pumila]RJG49418.1 hypothetical protein D1Z90_05510 [Motilimonas pumila]
MFRALSWLTIIFPVVVLAKASFPAGEGLSEYRQFLLFPYVDKAYKQMEQEDYKAAMENWHYALKVSPHNAVVSKELVRTYLKLGQYQQAYSLVEERQAYFDDPAWNRLQLTVVIAALNANQGALLSRSFELLNSRKFNEDELSGLLSAVLNYHLAKGEISKAFELRRRYLHIDTDNYTWHLSYAYALLSTGRLSAVAQLLTEPAFSQSDAGIEIERALLEAYVARDDQQNAIRSLQRLESLGELTVHDNLLWSNILVEQGDLNAAAGRLVPYKQNIEAQIQLAFIDLALQEDLGAARALRQVVQLMTNAEQERILIRMASELAQKSARLARRAYDYQVSFAENETLWRNKVINIALHHHDYDIARQALLQQTTSPEQQQKLLNIYLAQQNWPQAYVISQRQYQQAQGQAKLTRLNTYSYVLLQQGKRRDAKHVLMAHFPYISAGHKLKSQLLARLWSIESELSKQDWQKIETASSHLPASAKAQVAGLLAEQGRCQAAADLMSQSPRRSQLMSLAYCYQKQRSPFAYDYFLAAEALQSDRASTAQLAYYDAKYGDFSKAYERWLLLSKQAMPAADYLAATYTAIVLQQGVQGQRWLEQYQALNGEETAQYLTLQAQVYELNQQSAYALVLWRKSYQINPTRQNVLAIARLSEADEAKGILERSLIWLPNDIEVLSRLSLIAAQQQDYVNAAKYLEQVVVQTPDNYPLYEQLAYYHQFAGQTEQARQRLEQAIDAKDFYLQDRENPEQQLYHLKRFNTELQRQYALRIDYWAGDNAVPSHLVISANEARKKYSNYWNIELDWLDKRQSGPWGEWVMYGRVFGQAESNSAVFKPGGVDSLSLGVRYQPLRDVNWNFYFEPMYRFDQDVGDLMLRTTASLISDPEFSGDWHPGEDNYWLEQDMYLDASYLTHDDSYALLAKYSVGPHFKVSSSLARASSLRPYIMAQASSSNLGEDVRAGAGLSYNFWSGGTERMAYKQKSSVEVEYHHSFDTYLNGNNGVSLILRLAW